MRPSRAEIEQRVGRIVAEALDKSPSEIRPHSSLIDDLGAESIDFLDILFRIENDFGIKIPENELWSGELNLREADPAALEKGVAELKERTPDFRWDRFVDGVTRDDLPRLITVATVVDFLDRFLSGATDAKT